jgi:hypothetical protein
MKRKKSKKLKSFAKHQRFLFSHLCSSEEKERKKKTPTTPREKALLNITQI